MRICMLSQHPPFDIRSYYKIKKTFTNLGHEVWYINWIKRADEKNIVKPIEESPATVIKLFGYIGSPSQPLFIRGLKSIKAFMKIYQKISQISPDVLYINSPLLLPIALYCKKELKIPIIYDVYEDFYGVGVRRLFISFLEKLLVQKIDYLIVTTQGLKDKFSKFHEKIYVVYNSITPPKIPKETKEIYREKIGIKKEDIVVGYTGMISPIRGINKAIEALSHINDPNIHLLVVGGPSSELKKLEDLSIKYSIKDRIHLIESVSFKEIWNYYALIDIGLILYQPAPNHIRTLPNKLFDYVAMEIPVIASKIPEYMRAFPPHQNAILFVDATNPIEIAKKIKLLSNNPNMRLRMAKVAKNIFDKKYKWNLMEKKLDNLLKSILEERKWI